MKVLLVNLTYHNKNSYGILSLADALSTSGHEVKIAGTPTGMVGIMNDNRKRNLFNLVIMDFKPDIIGFSAMTPDADILPAISEYIKKNVGDIPLICGGYHALLYKDKVLEENPYIDFVFHGEAEDYLPKFLDKMEHADTNYDGIKGLIYRRNGSNKVNEIPEPVNFENIIPLRAYEFTSKEIMSTYKSVKNVSLTPMLQLNIPFLLSRGCPYNCSFCRTMDNPYLNMRYLSPESFRKQLDYTIDKFKHRSLFIHDSSFDLNKKWASRIMDVIKERKEIIEWSCYIRPNLVKEEFLMEMKESRCSTVSVYLEGGTERIRNEILRKEVSDEQITNAFTLAKKHGFFTKTNMIMGCPTESEEELKDGLKLIGRLKPDTAAFPFLTIIPGTELWEKYKDEMVVENYSDYDIGSAHHNLGRSDKKINFSLINHDVLMNLKLSVAFHYGGFHSMCRNRIDVRDKSVLILQSGEGNDFQKCAGILFNEFADYGEKRASLMYRKNIEIDPKFVATDIELKSVDTIPLNMDIADKVWDEIRAEQYDILVVPLNETGQECVRKAIDIASWSAMRRVFIIDMKDLALHEYDLRFKSLSTTQVQPGL